MRGFNVESNIQTEVIRYAVCISVTIQQPPSTRIIIRSNRHGYGPSRTVIQVHGQAEAVGKFEISYKFQVVRLVIRCRVPVTSVNGVLYGGIALTQFCTGISIG